MAVWLQRATLVGELVCVGVTDGLLRACACPWGVSGWLGGHRFGGLGWSDVSPAQGWGT